MRSTLQHELNEIAGIVEMTHEFTGKEPGTQYDPKRIHKNVRKQAKASVFAPGSTRGVRALTMHDKAAMKELHGIYERKGEWEDKEALFDRQAKAMGFDKSMTDGKFNEVADEFKQQGMSDPLFLKKLEQSWRNNKYEQAHSEINPAELIENGKVKIFTKDSIYHQYNFEGEGKGGFINGGLSGGHYHPKVIEVNNDLSNPYYLSVEKTINIPSGGQAHFAWQYKSKTGNKTGLTLPTPTGDANIAPVAGVHYNPTEWTVSTQAKTSVDNMDAFMPFAEKAFADYYKNNPSLFSGNLASDPRTYQYQQISVTFVFEYKNTSASNFGEMKMPTLFIDKSNF